VSQAPPSTRVGAAVRAEFPIFESATYLNSCSQGALSHRVRDAVEGWLAGWDENGAEWDFWVERNEAFRAAVAGLLHAEADDVAVTTSVSQGASGSCRRSTSAASANRIVISEYEFPTIGQIAHAQELRGAEVVHVRPDADGSIPPERFAEAIDERTALVCCTASPTAPATGTTWRRSPRRRTWRARSSWPTATRPAARSSSTSARSVPTSSPAERSSTCSAPPASGSCGSRRGARGARSDPDGLVCRRGHLCDVDADYSPHASARRFDAGTPPVPSLYAGVAGISLVEEAGCRRSRHTSRGSSTACSTASTHWGRRW
jgi:selenocysteine lyase/cysteine desulfurase